MGSRSALALSVILLLSLALASCAATQNESPAKPPAAMSPRVRALLVEYRDTLLAAEQLAEALVRSGTADPETVGGLRLERLGAELELAEKPHARIAILASLLEGARAQESNQQSRFEAAVATEMDVLAAKALRLKAEIALEREKCREP